MAVEVWFNDVEGGFAAAIPAGDRHGPLGRQPK
jgi:hypothetical protein